MFVIFGVANLCIWLICIYRAIVKKNPFGITPGLVLLGVYVWGDGLVVPIYWMLISVMGYLYGFNLFGFAAAIFITVRSLGEAEYWFLEQFAHTKRNHPKDMFGYKFIPSEAIYFVYQLVNQVVACIAIFGVCYFGWRLIK